MKRVKHSHSEENLFAYQLFIRVWMSHMISLSTGRPPRQQPENNRDPSYWMGHSLKRITFVYIYIFLNTVL